MKLRFVCFMIVFWGASALFIGCGGEDAVDAEEELTELEETMPGKFPRGTVFSITPAPGAIIPTNPEFTLRFDDYPATAVAVNGKSATGTQAGKVWVVSLNMEPGTGRAFPVEWTEIDGCTYSQAVGPYTVSIPED